VKKVMGDEEEEKVCKTCGTDLTAKTDEDEEE